MKHFKTLLATLLLLTAFVANAGNIPSKIWMVGNATKWGWRNELSNQDGAVDRPTKNEGGWYVYTWQNVDLIPGELKFLYTEDSKPNISWDKAYVYSDPKQKEISATDARKIGMTWFKGSDNKWTIGFSGKYDVTVRISENSESNIRDMYLTVEPVNNRFTEQYAARKIYLRGGATPNGWDLSATSTKMDFDPEHGIHTATGVQLTAATTGISDGLMRFTQFEDNKEKAQLCAGIKDNPSILATSTEQNPNEASVDVAFAETGEWNWSVPKTGKYNIEIQAPPYDEDFNGYANYKVKFTLLPEEKVTYTEHTIIAIGSAVEGTAPTFTYNENGKYTARVQLKGGETAADFALKFADTTTEDATKYYTATPATGETSVVVDGTTNDAKVTCSTAEPTNAWTIKQPGFYDITLQLLNDEKLIDGKEVGTVSFKKVTFAEGDIYLVGGATPNTWTLTEASTKMDYSAATGKYTQQNVLLRASGVKGSDGLLRFSKGYGNLAELFQLCPSAKYGDKAAVVDANSAIDTSKAFEALTFGKGSDWNWSVPTTGYYDIEIQAPETGKDAKYDVTFTFKKAATYTERAISAVGNAVAGVGYDTAKAIKFESKGNGLYEAKVELKGYGDTAPTTDEEKKKYSLKFLIDSKFEKALKATETLVAVEGEAKNLDMLYVEEYNPDNEWYIKDSGLYTITLNLNDNDAISNGNIAGQLSFTKIDYTERTFYLVGDATECSWDYATTNGLKMERVPHTPDTYRYTGEIYGLDGHDAVNGNFNKDYFAFKIVTAQGANTWTADQIRATEDWAQISASAVGETTTVDAVLFGTNDCKWIPAKSGKYEITLTMVGDYTVNQKVAELSFKLLEEIQMIYLGKAAGWDPSTNSTKNMTKTAEGKYELIFDYDSYITDKDNHKTIKFATNKGDWDKIVYLLPDYNGESFSENICKVTLGTSYKYNRVKAEKDANGNYAVDDFFWSLPEGNFGKFKVVVDPATQTVTFTGVDGQYTSFDKTKVTALYSTGILDWNFDESNKSTFFKPEGTDKVWYWSGDASSDACIALREENNVEIFGETGTAQDFIVQVIVNGKPQYDENNNIKTETVTKYVHEKTKNKLFRPYFVDNGTTYYFIARNDASNGDVYSLDGSDNGNGEGSKVVRRASEQQYAPRPEHVLPLDVTTDASKAKYFGLTEGSNAHYNFKLDLNKLQLVYNMQHSANEGGGTTAVEAVAGEGELSVGRVGDTLWVSGANGGEVLVVSMTGARMASSAGAEAVEISMEGWPNGIYIVCGNGKAVKIVK